MYNKIKIPQKICQRLKLHKWVWPSRNRALIAGKCKRCRMNYKTFWDTEKKKNPAKYI